MPKVLFQARSPVSLMANICITANNSHKYVFLSTTGLNKVPHHTNREELFFLLDQMSRKVSPGPLKFFKHAIFVNFCWFLPYFKGWALGFKYIQLQFSLFQNKGIYNHWYYCQCFFFHMNYGFFTSWHMVCTELFQNSYMNSSIIFPAIETFLVSKC